MLFKHSFKFSKLLDFRIEIDLNVSTLRERGVIGH